MVAEKRPRFREENRDLGQLGQQIAQQPRDDAHKVQLTSSPTVVSGFGQLIGALTAQGSLTTPLVSNEASTTSVVYVAT
jgi:hypothetical protein